MHRTEGENNDLNKFANGPPGTFVEEDWLNAVQEEIAYVIEQAGVTLKTAETETRQQLKPAIDLQIIAAFTATIAEINKACDLTVNGFFTTGNVNKMLYYLDTAPTGMSIDVALDDKLVFVTKGSVAGGETGGAAHSTGTWVLGGLTIDPHTHPKGTLRALINISGVDNYIYQYKDGLGFTPSYRGLSSSVGASVVSQSDSTEIAGATDTASVDTFSSDGSWRPAAYNHILCSLD